MEDEISLAKFLARYGILQGKDLNKVTHQDIRILCPYLKRSSFDEIREHPEYVIQGKVVLVNDGKHTIPYYAPNIHITEFDEVQEFVKEVENNVDYGYHDFSTMTDYELGLARVRKNNSPKNQREAKKEQENRGIGLKRRYDRREFKKIEEDY